MDDKIFTKEWKGRYSVWYLADRKGRFFLIKHQDLEALPGGTIAYENIPEPERRDWWFAPELCRTQEAIASSG